ncbi:putative Methyltransferase type 12 [Candidatus Methanoperedens nitroreducens]|uniref:Putative Methyltransferase type 12 n=1 Tax=Candidatus Methanoperedens nitratireducens TaxID=1392998 RepID=A0A284VRD0_9EURY|nr:putative Methyltransferase type 12 [Candidatus Methanoperedens nitroreducens]
MAQNCILCSSSSVFPIKFPKPTRQARRFMRCPVCELIFVPAGYHLSPQDEAARYRLHENTLLNEGYVRMFLEKIALVHRYCPDARTVLDYGCGPEPVLTQLLRREGFDCDVYDPYFFPVLPGGSYDLVISTEVFEHFRDVRAELFKIRSLLNPGGFLAVMTSFHDSAGDFMDWWYITDPTHVCFFSMRTFEWIEKEFGFHRVYIDTKNFIILAKNE